MSFGNEINWEKASLIVKREEPWEGQLLKVNTQRAVIFTICVQAGEILRLSYAVFFSENNTQEKKGLPNREPGCT